MTGKHLNDADIQQYVLQNTDQDMEVIEHMLHCISCKTKASEYKFLFDGIREQKKPAFDFNLTELVLEQLPANQIKASGEHSFFYLVVFISIFCVAVFVYLFSNSLINLFSAIEPMLFALIATTAVCFLLFLCIDMYNKYMVQMQSIDSY